MDKVYLVYNGHYSDRILIGVFSTKEKAEAAKTLYAADNNVEEWKIDSKDCKLSGLLPYQVHMVNSGTVVHVVRASIELFVKNVTVYNRYINQYKSEPTAIISVMAIDEENAIKVASEIRNQLIASYRWVLDPTEFYEKFKVYAHEGIDYD
jgi:hypothetical protein